MTEEQSSSSSIPRWLMLAGALLIGFVVLKFVIGLMWKAFLYGLLAIVVITIGYRVVKRLRS